MEEKPISKRKRKYIQGLADGKSKFDAAIDAGYSESTALSAKAHIETPDVRTAFSELIRERIPARKIVNRIAEGMDAQETKFFQQDGKVTDQRDVVAWGERRAYAELAAEFGGYFVPAKEVKGNGVFMPVQIVTNIQLPAFNE
jgi:phage terminase small subunit